MTVEPAQRKPETASKLSDPPDRKEASSAQPVTEDAVAVGSYDGVFASAMGKSHDLASNAAKTPVVTNSDGGVTGALRSAAAQVAPLQPKADGDSAGPTFTGASRQGTTARRPRITMDPPGMIQSNPLGGRLRLQYDVHDTPADSKVAWHHTAGKVASTNKGPSSSLEVHADYPGVTTVSSFVSVQGGDGTMTIESAPRAELVTSQSRTEISDLWSEEGKRSIPVIDNMQLGEDLVVTGRALFLAPGAELVAHLSNAPFLIKELTRLGPDQFRAVLTPQGLGLINGMLRIGPRNVNERHVTPARLHLAINPRQHIDDIGERAADSDDAASHVGDAWTEMHQKQVLGLHSLVRQLAVVDPDPPTPLWERLLAGAALIALSATTAGMGTVLAGAFATGEAMKEVVKVVIEESIQAAVMTGVGRAFTKTSTLPRMTIANFFATTQEEAIISAGAAQATKAVTTAKNAGRRLDHLKPGSGYRAVMSLKAAIHEKMGLAIDAQSRESLQAWCCLVAKLELGELRDWSKGKNEKVGTNLNGSVDVSNIKIGGMGLDQTPGVLRLELELADPSARRFAIKRSFVGGFSNETALNDIGNMPLRELNIPIVARFNENAVRGFVIGRNERHRLFADADGDLLAEKGGGSNIEGARQILEDELGSNNVFPKRG